jgi:hypothetical protein
MQVKNLLVATLVAASLQGCATRLPPRPVPTEVWSGDDTELGIRFRDALESAFQASPAFTPSFGKRPGTLIVECGAVRSREVGRRLRAFYSVTFRTPSDRLIGMRTGTCWSDELGKCAEQVVDSATKVADKGPR